MVAAQVDLGTYHNNLLGALLPLSIVARANMMLVDTPHFYIPVAGIQEVYRHLVQIYRIDKLRISLRTYYGSILSVYSHVLSLMRGTRIGQLSRIRQ